MRFLCLIIRANKIVATPLSVCRLIRVYILIAVPMIGLVCSIQTLAMNFK